MDISMDEPEFNDGGDSSDNYAPVKKTTKNAPKKPSVAPTSRVVKPTTKKALQNTTKTKITTKKRTKATSEEENSDDGGDTDDDSLLSNTPPSAKRLKKAPGPKMSSGKPLQAIDNESFGMDGTIEAKPKKPGTASDQYQKLTQLEHILKRPDTYIGSVERTEQEMWVYNSETDSMERREVSFVPGLYKIFDEILVNAADNKVRDKNMDEIKVRIDREKGEISVENNGRGIPIEIHAKEGIYIPELIFGHLLAGSNFNDDEQKVTGGRNGYGAKLCNVFSTKFMLETADAKSKQVYKQTWTNNMSKMQPAKITPIKGADYTKITFFPDFSKFGMDGMDNDFEAIAKRRVYDMAGTCKDVKVSLNGQRLKVRNFKKYMEMYTKALKPEKAASDLPIDEEPPKDVQVILTDNPNAHWEVGFAVSDGSFQQVSFVNSIATTTGGTHVNYVADQVVTKILEIVKKKNKGGVALKNNQIRNHIFLFVNCLIVNPAFTSQTKEQLTTKASQFGSKCVLSEKFLKDIAKTEVINNIIHFAQRKADQVLKKSDGNKRTRMNNAKLTDANKAGTKEGHRCTLILTEGDSASLLALAGRAVVDPDLIGVFPLRGKILNVRDASVDQISKNQEIQNIKKFMGLQHKRHYEDTKSLRYGSLMIMTDQDHDGSHIKGLLINFLEVSFPSLLKIPGFLKEFITPIVKVWKGDPKNPKKLQSFFTMPQYEAWKLITGNERGWEHKYFKGLGTSSPSDAEIYFRDLDRHLKEFQTLKPHEPELIDLAFSKKKADARKEWLRQFRPGTFLDMTPSDISYDDFINKELILFSMADNQRSIPSVIDGFKPGQRKVLYTCFRRNLKKDVKVVELAGSVSGLTAYAYGDTSLQQTIVGLAQNFVGSNNVNCLEPSGNFGSRLQGGSDAASARYIYTRLSPFARKVFHATDEPLLSYNTDDGKTIEPEMYIPIVPMILINGADGIGTGWSTSIPNYNPEDVVENLLIRMNGESKDDMKPMKPWFRGWKGEAEDLGQDRFKFSGIIQHTGDNEIEITELPVRMWTQDFKEKLEEIIKAEKVVSFIKDYTEYNTPIQVHFIIKMEEKQLNIALAKGLEETFKLSKTMATSNLVAFDPQGRICKYATVLDILEEFYVVRLKCYMQRKKHMIETMEKDFEKLTNQARFIKMIIDGELVISKKQRQVLVAELKQKGFKSIPKVVDARKEGEFETIVDTDLAENEEIVTEGGAHDYDYLLGMAIWSLTQERVDKLAKQMEERAAEIEELRQTSPKDIWRKDLQEFLEEWRFQLQDEAQRAKKIASMGRRTSAKLRIKGKPPSKKRKADDSDDSDFAIKKSKKLAQNPTQTINKTKPTGRGNIFTNYTSSPEPDQAPAVNAIEQKLVSKSTAMTEILKKDDFTNISDVDGPSLKKPQAVKEGLIGKPPKKAIGQRPLKEDEDDDAFLEAVADLHPEKIAPSTRQPRAATSKPKYNLSEDTDASSDDFDKLLGDVSNMVKGIPSSGNGTTVGNSAKTSLFATSLSRPSHGHGISSKAPKVKNQKLETIPAGDNDDTNYEKLVPRDSPQKVAARTAREVVMSEEDEDSFGITAPRASLKTSTVPSSMAIKPKKDLVPVAKSRQTMASSQIPSTKEKKPAPLSPAARAYAAKQAREKAVPRVAMLAKHVKTTAKAKSKAISDDDTSENEDDNGLVNELLSDDEMTTGAGLGNATIVATTTRPTRRAVTTKTKYTVDLDSDEMDSSVVEDDDDEDEEEDISYGGGDESE